MNLVNQENRVKHLEQYIENKYKHRFVGGKLKAVVEEYTDDWYIFYVYVEFTNNRCADRLSNKTTVWIPSNKIKSHPDVKKQVDQLAFSYRNRKR